MLSFAEQLYIRLQYNPEENALTDFNDFSSGLIAAAGLTANLLIERRIQLDSHQLAIVDSRPTQDPLLDEALARLASIGPINREDSEWFRQIADKLPLGANLFQQLISKNIIYAQEKKGFLGLSKTLAYPFRDPTMLTTLFETERAIMLHNATPNPYTATQIFMAYCWGAEFPWKLSRQENKQYDQRWETIFGEYWGWYDKNAQLEPIPGLDPNLRYALADLTISWATVHVL
jgi:hypothetical protein